MAPCGIGDGYATQGCMAPHDSSDIYVDTDGVSEFPHQ